MVAHDLYMGYVCNTDVGGDVTTFHCLEHARMGFSSIEAHDPSLRLSSLSVSKLSYSSPHLENHEQFRRTIAESRIW
jgi:hypothetical protein